MPEGNPQKGETWRDMEYGVSHTLDTHGNPEAVVVGTDSFGVVQFRYGGRGATLGHKLVYFLRRWQFVREYESVSAPKEGKDVCE